MIGEETKAGPVFAEAFIQTRFFVPSVFVIVDVVVGLWIGEVELRRNVSLRGGGPELQGILKLLPRLVLHERYHLHCKSTSADANMPNIE